MCVYLNKAKGIQRKAYAEDCSCVDIGIKYQKFSEEKAYVN